MNIAKIISIRVSVAVSSERSSGLTTQYSFVDRASWNLTIHQMKFQGLSAVNAPKRVIQFRILLFPTLESYAYDARELGQRMMRSILSLVPLAQHPPYTSMKEESTCVIPATTSSE